MLRAEYKTVEENYFMARFRAEYDIPYIRAEVQRFESVVDKLTSNDVADIYCRHRGFLFSSWTNRGKGPFKDTIFKCDLLKESCEKVKQQLIDLGHYQTVAVDESLYAFQNDQDAPN